MFHSLDNEKTEEATDKNNYRPTLTGFVNDLCLNQVAEIFEDQVNLGQDREIFLHYASIYELSNEQRKLFLDLVDSNIGEFYCRYQGLSWRNNKWIEMQEEGLMYVWYTDDDGNLVGFISFLLTYDEVDKVMYLYEVQVDYRYRKKGIGRLFIESFHGLAKKLKNLSQQEDSNKILYNEGTNLTVFSDNILALAWYRRMGYTLTDDSPRDKLLRGKILKPNYYLLSKRIM